MNKTKNSKNPPAPDKARVLELLSENPGATKRDLAKKLGLKGSDRITLKRQIFPFVRTMAVDDVIAMLGTYSRAIVASTDDRARALDDARAALAQRFPGADTIDVPMRAWCWRAARISRA